MNAPRPVARGALYSSNAPFALFSVDPMREIRATGAIVAGVSLNHDVVVTPLFRSRAWLDADNAALRDAIRHDGVSV